MSENVTGYEPQDLIDIPTMIKKLIDNQIRSINTCYIAKITEINENKVSVINSNKYLFKDKEQDYPIINNCLVAIPQCENLKINLPLKVGDYGICVVTQEDYTNYKKNGNDSAPNTPRKFDISDSIFIPFSLFQTQSIDSEKFSIEYTEGSKLEFDKENLNLSSQKDSKIEIKEALKIECKDISIESSSEIEIKNSKGSLMDVCDTIFQAMDLLATGMKGSGTEPSAFKGGKDALLQKIKGILK